MLKSTVVFFLLFITNPLYADAGEDIDFFMSHFLDDAFWSPARNSGRLNVAYEYEEELRAKDIQVVDEARFRDMIPAEAVQEIIDQQETLVAETISEHYGAAHLSDIAEFFHSPTGERMLLIAEEEGTFASGRSVTDWNEGIQSWADNLPLQDFTRYNAFTRTPAGTFFIHNALEIRQISMSRLTASPYFFKPNLNQEFVLQIFKAEGVVEFPNRFVRQTMIREIEATLE
ncbi:hypothetical protein [Yoonia sp. SS1-5]|uniref:DUF2927 domain-containing protein n=1 Tax=Yoonia rhodophyticola TaxID=3137370 RepID=A0AAN0M608_9RHOB